MSGSRARPTSASSRTAWGDYGHARPDSQFDFGGQDGIRDEADLSAGVDDDYMDKGGKSKTSGAVVPSATAKTSTSCFGKIGRGIRCEYFLLLSSYCCITGVHSFIHKHNNSLESRISNTRMECSQGTKLPSQVHYYKCF